VPAISGLTYRPVLMSVEIDVLRVLADPVRRRIVELLARESLCTCHLVEELGAKQPSVSHHLKALREAGLVDGEPYGRFTYYRLRPDAVQALAEQLQRLAADARFAARRAC
jgi:ArsR family transcriptional regulator